MSTLSPGVLAVDLGLRTGLALFGADGRLRWYRSSNLGSTARLRRAVWGVLDEAGQLAQLVLEGDRRLGGIWARAAEKRGAGVRWVAPETWRSVVLPPRMRRSGADAKHHADAVARHTIAWSGAKKPTGALRHDAAEAILIGLWAVWDLGWLPDLQEVLGTN